MGAVRFERLEIENFRAIREFAVSDLSDLVVIAGPNGCGKSCILDAIRLLKSAYGGYQSNEWQMWFGEFQVSLNDRTTIRGLFRDATKPIRIEADLTLAASEIDYLKEKAEELCEAVIWFETTQVGPEALAFSTVAYSVQFPHLAVDVKQRAKVAAVQLREQLDKLVHTFKLIITTDGTLQAEFSLLGKVLFTTYDPRHLGIIDFHSASRTYTRETVAAVNLDEKSLESNRRVSTLYNYQGKYSNVKSELLAMYVRTMVARQAGQDSDAFERFDSILKELFLIFFPDKTYMGARANPNGAVTFPVRLSSGEEHDINDLSSGEKEVLYGYLRLRSSTPANSTILLDEPELHLNPALLQGFPDFYYRQLAKLDNHQVWLVTHSDVLLRKSVGNPNFTVIHMVSGSVSMPGSNQAVLVGQDELQTAVLDLVGDLAAYRPTGKLIIFEGGGNSNFDVEIVSMLFPLVAQNNNLVSGGHKLRVESLYQALQRAAEESGIANKVYAITDRDNDNDSTTLSGNSEVLSWDVYHIENYLLEPKYLLAAYASLTHGSSLTTEDEVRQALITLAKADIERLVLVQLQNEVNSAFVKATVARAAPDSKMPAEDLLPSITASLDRLAAFRDSWGNFDYLAARETQIRSNLAAMFEDGGDWERNFPGRVVLKAFANKYLSGIASYDGLVNIVLSQMIGDGHRPSGMVAVLAKIVPRSQIVSTAANVSEA